MAGEHHFSGKIMTASQHSGRKRSEQLLQSLAVSTNRFLPETEPSLQQNQQGQREEGMRGKEEKKKRRSWWVDHSFPRPSLSCLLFREQFFNFFFSLMPLAGAVILFMVPVWYKLQCWAAGHKTERTTGLQEFYVPLLTQVIFFCLWIHGIISRTPLDFVYRKAGGLRKRVPKVSRPAFLSLREWKQCKTINFSPSVVQQEVWFLDESTISALLWRKMG